MSIFGQLGAGFHNLLAGAGNVVGGKFKKADPDDKQSKNLGGAIASLASIVAAPALAGGAAAKGAGAAGAAQGAGAGMAQGAGGLAQGAGTGLAQGAGGAQSAGMFSPVAMQTPGALTASPEMASAMGGLTPESLSTMGLGGAPSAASPVSGALPTAMQTDALRGGAITVGQPPAASANLVAPDKFSSLAPSEFEKVAAPSGPGFFSDPTVKGAAIQAGTQTLSGLMQARAQEEQDRRNALLLAAKTEAEGGQRAAGQLTSGTQNALGQIIQGLTASLR